jgi:hypothetical protein
VQGIDPVCPSHAWIERDDRFDQRTSLGDPPQANERRRDVKVDVCGGGDPADLFEYRPRSIEKPTLDRILLHLPR